MNKKVNQVLQVLKVLHERKRENRNCYTCNTCNTSNTSAFTIVEMLLYMSLLAMFILVLVDILTAILKSQLKTQALSAYAQDSRFIVQKMSYDFSNSTDFDTTISLYSIDEDGRMIFDSEYLNREDTIVSDFSMTKIDNSVQVKFLMDGKDFQLTFNQR